MFWDNGDLVGVFVSQGFIHFSHVNSVAASKPVLQVVSHATRLN